jgi:hypothetical protein
MAVGTVSGIVPEDNWQLISTTTPSGTNFTLTGFDGYRHLWLVGKSITKSASTQTGIRPNNDTSGGSYGASWSVGTATSFLFSGDSSGAAAMAFKIFNIDKSIPHKIEGEYDANDWLPQSVYANPVPITSLLIRTNNGTATFTGGTFYLYGIPA